MTRYLVLAIDDSTPGYADAVIEAVGDLVEASPDGMLVATEVTKEALEAGGITAGV